MTDDSTDRLRMVDVLWDGENVKVFPADLRARATIVSKSLAQSG